MSVLRSNLNSRPGGSHRRFDHGVRPALVFVVALALMVFAAACGGDGSGTAAEVEISGLGDAEQSADTARADKTEPSASTTGATGETAGTADTEPVEEASPVEETDSSDGATSAAGVGTGAAEVGAAGVGENLAVSTVDGETLTTVQGSIDELGQVDVYTMPVRDGEAFVVEQLGGCVFGGNDSLYVRVSGAGINQAVWLDQQDIDQDCLEISRHEPQQDGTVVIEVGHGQNDITGSYAFQLINVADDPLVTLSMGETVQGNLEFTGSNDVYAIPVVADQAVLIRQLGGCDFSGGDQVVMGVRGPGVNQAVWFDEYDVQGGTDCVDHDRFDATEDGTLIIRVEDSKNLTTGTYSFEVTDVTGQPPLVVGFGEVIAADSPAPGAGVIEQPGIENKYLLPVSEGQSFVIKQLGGCSFDGDDSITISVRGPGLNSSVYFDEYDLEDNTDCDESNRFDVTEDGTVVIISRHAANEATGTYSFELVDVTNDPPVQLNFGDVVGPGGDVAGGGGIAGTGVLEVGGEHDVYWFNVAQGQTFAIEGLGNCNFSGDDDISLSVKGPGVNSSITMREQDLEANNDCLRVDRFVAAEDGRMVITVMDAANDVTGTYNFTLTAGAETADEAQSVLEELGAEETDEGTLITIDETVLFAFGSDDLKPGSASELSKVADVLGVYVDGTVRVVGHTDSVGEQDDNQRLSERRAAAVVDALEELGVNSARMETSGAGETNPVADNTKADGSDNEDGRAQNRRVEIFFDAAR